MRISEVTLFIEDFDVYADIGIHEFEIGNRQKLLINVEMVIPGDIEFSSDRLSDTIDYDFIRLGIARLCGERRYRTQEALCHDILALLFEKPGVLRACVTTRKVEVYPDARSAGCRMSASLN